MLLTMSSSHSVTFRQVEVGDANAIREIYNREVLGSRVTLDLVPRSLADQIAWIQQHQGVYPALAAIIDTNVVGFASVSPYRIRPGYSTTVEDSIYIDPNYQGRGIGKALLSSIVDLAARHGFHSCMARVGADHVASISLHKSLGFSEVGIEREVGRKFGKWVDIMLLQILL